MSDKYITSGAAISATADAIREKLGISNQIEWRENYGFAKDVGAIATEVELQEKTVTENGSVMADDGYGGLSKVIVNVEPKLQDKTVTENGTYSADSGYDGLGTVTVNVESNGGGSSSGWNSQYAETFTVNAKEPVFTVTCEIG